ncbi:cyclin-U1-1 [Nymphaea colorata]|nr:cyclin-U1-1 [Nymphaea colorata]
MPPAGLVAVDDDHYYERTEDGSPAAPDSDEAEASSSAMPRVLTMLSVVLERLVARNDQVCLDLATAETSRLSVFHGVKAPSISISKYLERIYRYTNCSPSCFVVGYIFIDRLVHRNPSSPVVSLNVHRLLVTSIMVATKVLDDVHYNNAFYARVGGVSNEELNRLELELLFLLDFSVMVTSRVFESYCLHLEKEMLWYSSERKIEKLPPLSLDNGEEAITEEE